MVFSMSLEDVKGLGKKKDVLIEAGIDSVEKLASASVEDLTQLKGIGKATAEKFVSNAKKLLSAPEESTIESDALVPDQSSEDLEKTKMEEEEAKKLEEEAKKLEEKKTKLEGKKAEEGVCLVCKSEIRRLAYICPECKTL